MSIRVWLGLDKYWHWEIVTQTGRVVRRGEDRYSTQWAAENSAKSALENIETEAGYEAQQ